jgi:hypothetical protein
MTDLYGPTIALVAVIIAFISAIVPAYIFYRLENLRPIEDLRERLAKIEAAYEDNSYISDQISNVLSDLYEAIASLKSYIELTRDGRIVNDSYFDEFNEQLGHLERHFYELDLFSPQLNRRLCAQQALATMLGDMATLELMQKVADRNLGQPDQNILWAIEKLKSRLRKIFSFANSKEWTG